MNPSLRKGLRQLEQRQYQAAHAGAIALIHGNVRDPVAYLILARIAEAHDNFPKATQLYQRAKELGSNDAMFAAAQAQFLVGMGRQGEAVEVAEQAASMAINDAYVADTIGVVYSRTGFHEKAVPFFERAVELSSAPANFHYNLGASLQFAGDFAAARTAFEGAIEREPASFKAWSSLVNLEPQSETSNHLEALEKLFSGNKANPDAALHLGHAIAKTLEDLGRFEDSFDWLLRAKREKRTALGYSVDADLALFAAVSDMSAPTVANRDRSKESPIFVVGLPRTGTTLVDRILSSHPDVTAAGELNTFADLIKSAAATTSNQVLDPETLAAVAETDLANTGRAYLAKTQKLARGAKRFTDKMPLNFFYAGLICRALPAAKIIVLRRDPVDSCLSNFRQLFATGFSYYNYSLDMSDTAAYYRAFDRLIAHWRQSLPAENLLEVHYEKIVHDQENQTRRLLDFCDLSWNEACLRFHQNSAPVSTASSVQVRQPLYSGSIDRWKKYGNRLNGLRRDLGLLD